MTYLTDSQQADFHQNGYVVIHDLLDPEKDLQPVIDEYNAVLERLAIRLHSLGVITSLYQGLTFPDRLARIYAESGQVHAQSFDFSLPQRGVTHDTPLCTGPAVFNLLRHHRLLDAVESLIGPEIYSNPVQHVRLKPPEDLIRAGPAAEQVARATPWHQDNGVVTEDADETDMVTAWLPMTDTTEEMGCLAVVPGSHRQGLLTHCPGERDGALHVPSQLFRESDAVPLPLPRGDGLLMDRRTLHASLPNRSSQLRWSFDLRFQPIGQATGRTAFPGFVARSKRRPASELHDPVAWAERWVTARSVIADGEQPRFNRWDNSAPVCA